MLYDFRPTGWKMTIILLQQPAINRAEEYMEWRAEWGLQCKKAPHKHMYGDTLSHVLAYRYIYTPNKAQCTVTFYVCFAHTHTHSHTNK